MGKSKYSGLENIVDSLFALIVCISLVTAHLDIIRFINVFKKTFLAAQVNNLSWDYPWLMSSSYADHDFPYSIPLYVIGSLPTHIFQLTINNNPSNLTLIVLAKIPIVLCLAILYRFLKANRRKTRYLLILLLSPQLLLQQVIAGQYDLIVYMILFLGIESTVKTGRTYAEKLIFMSSFTAIGSIFKLTSSVVAAPILIFMYSNFILGELKNIKINYKRIILISFIIILINLIPIYGELVIRNYSQYYSEEVGSGGMILLRRTNPLPFSSFCLSYLFSCFLAIYASLKKDISKMLLENEKDICLFLMILVGLAFSIQTSNSLGWTSIITIAFLGLSLQMFMSLRKYLYLYYLAYLFLFVVMPNSPLLDSFQSFSAFCVDKFCSSGLGSNMEIGLFYHSISNLLSRNIANSIWDIAKAIYPLTAFYFYIKTTSQLKRLLN